MNSNAALAGVNASSGVASIFQSLSQANAYRTQGEIAERSAKLNAEFAGLQAEDAVRRGDVQAGRHLTQTKKLVGSQRASLAAQGINIDTGSALDTQVEAGALGAEDAAMIRTNAFREALGFRSQSSNYEMAGKLAKLSADNAVRDTLLTGGLRAAKDLGEAGKYYGEYKKDKAGAEARRGYSIGYQMDNAYRARKQ